MQTKKILTVKKVELIPKWDLTLNAAVTSDLICGGDDLSHLGIYERQERAFMTRMCLHETRPFIAATRVRARACNWRNAGECSKHLLLLVLVIVTAKQKLCMVNFLIFDTSKYEVVLVFFTNRALQNYELALELYQLPTYR